MSAPQERDFEIIRRMNPHQKSLVPPPEFWPEWARKDAEQVAEVREETLAINAEVITAARRVVDLYNAKYIRGHGDGGRAAHAMMQLNQSIKLSTQ